MDHILYININQILICLIRRDSSQRRKRRGSHEEDGLAGLLRLCTAVMRHDPPFKFCATGLVGIFL